MNSEGGCKGKDDKKQPHAQKEEYRMQDAEISL
jgi:hypothetical protein